MIARVMGILLILGGTLGLVYGGFTYTVGVHSTQVGPVELSTKDKDRVNIPTPVAVGAIAAGGLLLLMAGRKIRRNA